MNSIFGKQFFLYMGSLLISFILIGAGLTQAFSSYFVTQRIDGLTIQGKKISKVFEQAYYFGGIYDREKLNEQITLLDDYLEASFIYVDNSGTILMISNDIDTKWLGQEINIDDVKKAISGEIVSFENLFGGIFDKTVITVGYPITVHGNTIGAVFLSSPMTDLQETTNDALKIIVFIVFIAGILGFVLIYMSSKKLVKPLLEMNEAAKVISGGNFEKRLIVKGKDEIAQLAVSFNEMAESLNEQENRRKEFLSNISHDLRSPLTSMKGFLQAIIDGTVPYEKQNHYLNIILDESDRLAKMANNIIDINMLDNSNYVLEISRFDINELIRKIVYNFETRIVKKNISVNVELAENKTYVDADYEKIQRVIYNLIDNAVKFTNDGGIIDIETDVEKEKVFVKIKDNGRGISNDEQKRIFERFYKADSSRGEDKMGSGLGLSIVKEFIKAHNETINVKSELGNGCEFVFSLKRNF